MLSLRRGSQTAQVNAFGLEIKLKKGTSLQQDPNSKPDKNFDSFPARFIKSYGKLLIFSNSSTIISFRFNSNVLIF